MLRNAWFCLAALAVLVGLGAGRLAAQAPAPACTDMLLPIGERLPVYNVQGLSVCLHAPGPQSLGTQDLHIWLQNVGTTRTPERTLSLDILSGSEVLLRSIRVEVPALEGRAVQDVWVPVKSWPKDAVGWQLTAVYK